ncbi:serine hydrolase [Phytoactinopolyspora halophila]|nr:serine hydrolase [Phytoactinopolyspora halophila]
MRRASLSLVAVGALALGLVAGLPARADGPSGHRDSQPGHRAGPPTVTPDDIRFTPERVLRKGSPEDVGLLPERIEQIAPRLAGYLGTTPETPEHPMYAGAVVLAAKDGVIVEHAAVGDAVRYSGTRTEDGDVIGIELPETERIPMREDTIVDLASVSKLFCTVVVLQLVEDGAVDLDAPVTTYIPEFGQNGKDEITVRQLLTHTSGMRAWLPLHSSYPTPEERIEAVYESTLQPDAEPGAQYLYSDLGLITLGKIAERVTGRTLDELVAERITEPLGMTDTMYNPPESLRERIAATEHQPALDRGMVWGEVHDENAWSLGGVAGHAGLFSTAADLAIFAQTLLNGGQYGDARILSEDSVRQAITNQNAGIAPEPASRRGLGFELNKHWYMGPLASPVTFGHTGFTGTSLVIDPLSDSFAIVLTNRVHPTRAWGGNNPARRAVTEELGLAVPVHPATGDDAWFTDHRDGATHTLDVPFARRAGWAARLSFRLWYDTEDATDAGHLEASTDGGESWDAVPFDLKAADHRWSTDGSFSGFQGRQWLRAEAKLPVGTTDLRWNYTADATSRGRGVYVDAVSVIDWRGMVFNDRRPGDAERWEADGWVRSAT